MKKFKVAILAVLSVALLSEAFAVTASAVGCEIYPPHSFQGAWCRYHKKP